MGINTPTHTYIQSRNDFTVMLLHLFFIKILQINGVCVDNSFSKVLSQNFCSPSGHNGGTCNPKIGHRYRKKWDYQSLLAIHLANIQALHLVIDPVSKYMMECDQERYLVSTSVKQSHMQHTLLLTEFCTLEHTYKSKVSFKKERKVFRITLHISKDSSNWEINELNLNISNVGESRCLLISLIKDRKWRVHILSIWYCSITYVLAHIPEYSKSRSHGVYFLTAPHLDF